MLPDNVVVPSGEFVAECCSLLRIGGALQPAAARLVLATLQHDAVVAFGRHFREKEQQETLENDDCAQAVLLLQLVALGLLLFNKCPERREGWSRGALGVK